jgi:hypothetical protein
MGLLLVGLRAWWPLSTDGLARQALFLGAGLTLGMTTYLAAAWLFGLDEIRTLGRMLWRRRMRTVTA